MSNVKAAEESRGRCYGKPASHVSSLKSDCSGQDARFVMTGLKPGVMTIYFVAGEVSGDIHGADLMRALRQLHPNLNFIGRGGPEMKAVAGQGFHDWLRHAAVLGLWEVVRKYGYFRRQFREALQEIEKQRPNAIILIDYPGFNLRLARALRRRAAAHKILYYISPQVWAWHRGRINADQPCDQ